MRTWREYRRSLTNGARQEGFPYGALALYLELTVVVLRAVAGKAFGFFKTERW